MSSPWYWSLLDLIAADQRIIWTVPQSLFDKAPRLLELIEAAERTEPAQGPFRIHRMAAWQPLGWFVEHSEGRHEEMLRWQRDTLLPLLAVPLSIETTHVLGPTELFDQALLFEPSLQVANPRTAEALKLNPGDRYVSYPRQSFDLWNTRYFILPAQMLATDLNRGFASLLPNTELLYPDAKILRGPRSRRTSRPLAQLRGCSPAQEQSRVSPSVGGTPGQAHQADRRNEPRGTTAPLIEVSPREHHDGEARAKQASTTSGRWPGSKPIILRSFPRS